MDDDGEAVGEFVDGAQPVEEGQSEAVARMKKAKLTSRRANDILRATGLPALPLTDPGVKRDLLKLLNGEKLSPVLVFDRQPGADIADGYHRVSLAYNIDPFMSVPLRLG